MRSRPWGLWLRDCRVRTLSGDRRTLWRRPRRGFRPRYKSCGVALRPRCGDGGEPQAGRLLPRRGGAAPPVREALTRNAYATASIEGNPLTLTDVESLLASLRGPSRARADDGRSSTTAGLPAAPRRGPLPEHAREVRKLHACSSRRAAADRRLQARPELVAQRSTGRWSTSPRAGRRGGELAAALSWYHASREDPLLRTRCSSTSSSPSIPSPMANGR